MTMWSYLPADTPFGGLVILLLLGLSVWMWVLILLKWAQFHWLRRREQPLDCCLEMFAAAKEVSGWQGALWQQYHDVQSGAVLEPRLLTELGEQLAQRLERSVRTILVLAQIAPLLGLVGTVMGMIVTFDVIHALGSGNLQELSRGISQALTTTQGGLLVAIPGLVVGSLLRRQAERFRDRIEAFSIAAGRSLKQVTS